MRARVWRERGPVRTPWHYEITDEDDEVTVHGRTFSWHDAMARVRRWLR